MERWNYCPGAKYYKGFKFCFLATPLKVIKKKKKQNTKQHHLIQYKHWNHQWISRFRGLELSVKAARMLRAHPVTCLNTRMAVERHALLPAGSQRRPPAGRAASSGRQGDGRLAGHQEPNFQVFAAAKSPRRRTTGNVSTPPFHVCSLNTNVKYLYHVWCYH